MRPLHILASMEALTITGPARNLFEFARVARECGSPVRVTVVTYRRASHPATDPFLEGAASAGLACEVVAERGPFDRAVGGRLRELASRLQPDIIQTHNNKSHFLIRSSGLAKQYPWVAFHHGYTAPTRRQQVYNLLDRWSLRSARRVVTVTRAFVPELRAAGVSEDRILVIANSIRAEWAPPRSTVRGRRILAIGRLSREKAHSDLIRALARLRGGEPAELTLVGEGHERAALAEEAARLKVKVHFAGQVADVRPYLAEADIFVLPSWSEGSPNVLLEAMAARVPVVATTVGGVPDTVTHEQEGLLVPPAQPEALALAIDELLANPERARAFGEAGYQRIVREFTPAARCRKLLEFYESLAQRPT